MDSAFYSVPVSLLRQHCFCPRIPYFVLVKGLQPTTSLWVSQGVNFHEKAFKLFTRRHLKHWGLDDYKLLSAVSLKGKELRVHGICDGVIIAKDRAYPIEFKLRKESSQSKGSLVQLTCYAMLIEEQLQLPVTSAFFAFGQNEKLFSVEINPNLRTRVCDVLKEIYDNCEHSLLPHSCANEAQCAQCEYLNFCADRL